MESESVIVVMFKFCFLEFFGRGGEFLKIFRGLRFCRSTNFMFIIILVLFFFILYIVILERIFRKKKKKLKKDRKILFKN